MDEYTIGAAILFTIAALSTLVGFPLAMLDNPRRRRREAPEYVMIVRSPGGHGPSGAGKAGEDPDHTRPESGIALAVPTTRTDSTR